VRAGRENGPYPNFQRFDVSEDAWKPVVSCIKAHGALAIAQMMHAGAIAFATPRWGRLQSSRRANR
jgi:2,4-dienoyl-CoA reductase-like NADH-dependent reductase (Old Yellow Enzyme family)